jgi:hypothetical protein
VEKLVLQELMALLVLQDRLVQAELLAKVEHLVRTALLGLLVLRVLTVQAERQEILVQAVLQD